MNQVVHTVVWSPETKEWKLQKVEDPSRLMQKRAAEMKLIAKIRAIRPQRALRSPENPNATLDTLASRADDVRQP